MGPTKTSMVKSRAKLTIQSFGTIEQKKPMKSNRGTICTYHVVTGTSKRPLDGEYLHLLDVNFRHRKINKKDSVPFMH